MTAHTLRAIALLVLTASSGAFGQDLIEKVVVRNRLFVVDGRFEVTPSAGLTLVNRLTRHYNFNLGLGYNVSETLAFELRGGYALSGHTGLADQVAEGLLIRNPANEVTQTSDLTRLWVMKANGILGVRWAPLYGKISLMAELPVHFQAYLWFGGGAAMLERESLVYCQQVGDRATGLCGTPDQSAYLKDDKVSWIGSGAAGFRFFLGKDLGLQLELRNYVYPDAYLENINRAQAEAGVPTGTEATSPGLINLVLLNAGITFLF